MMNYHADDLISIIIPVYNAEEYLSDCLKSVLNQTYQNFELIMINDGSTDNSMSIARKYLHADSRVKIFNQSNKGVSSARNTGIKHSLGGYVIFIDADDTVSSELLEILHANIKIYSADISCSQIANIKSSDDQWDYSDANPEVVTYSGFQALEQMLYHKGIYMGPCAKLYKKSAIAQELFDSNIQITEDLDFNYRVLKRSDRVCVSLRKLYFVLLHTNSATSREYRRQRIQAIEVSKRILNDVSSNYIELLSSAQNMLFMMAFLIIYTYGANMEKADRDLCRRIIIQERKTVLLDTKSRFRIRMYALGSYFGLTQMITVIKITKTILGK